MSTSGRGAKVSLFSRILASMLAASGAFAFVVIVFHLGQQENVVGAEDPLGAMFVAFGAPILFAMSAFVAITGRSPRWMTRLENAHDQTMHSHRDGAQSVATVRRFARLGAVVTYGLLLIVLGFKLNIFSSETSWVGTGIFAIAWVVTVVLIWRYFGRLRASKDAHK